MKRKSNIPGGMKVTGFGRKIRSGISVVLGILVLMGTGCSAISKGSKSYVKDGKTYGVTKGLFRQRWWNYYERGISFADGQFWKEAEEDFRVALRLRGEDKRRARTYGMHFVDYFPHRELGVVLFHQGRYPEAVQELETSLKSVKTAKTEFYLDRTRKVLIEQEGKDAQAPEIIIESPAEGSFFNGFATVVAGTVRDDSYVKEIQVNGVEVRIDLAATEIPFNMEVPLKGGENPILVMATDLTGKSSLARRKVLVDRQGPVLNIDEPAEGTPPSTPGLRLKGFAYDDSGIREIRVNGRTILNSTEREVPLDHPLSLSVGEDRVIVEALDQVGNQTRAEIRLGSKGTARTPSRSLSENDPVASFRRKPESIDAHSLRMPTFVGMTNGGSRPVLGQPPSVLTHPKIFLASLDVPEISISRTDLPRFAFGDGTRGAAPDVQDLSASGPLLLAANEPQDTNPPAIELKGWTEEQTVFLDQAYLEGNVRDDGSVEQLLVNNIPILRKPGKNVYFSYLAELGEGENTFAIQGKDGADNQAEVKIRINRKLQKIREVGSRMAVALLPLDRKGEIGAAGEGVEDLLLGSLTERSRFEMVERQRLEDVLREQQLSSSDLADQDAAVRLGKILTANAILMGSVLEKENSLEIFGRVVDTESSLILAAADVYGENVDAQVMRQLCQGLVIKLCDELPLAEGLVVQVKGKKIVVDLGKESRVKKGMQLIVFREGEPVKHPVTGQVLGAETEELGYARILAVLDQMSNAELLQDNVSASIEPLAKVITR